MGKAAQLLVFVLKAGLIFSSAIGVALTLTTIYWRDGLMAHGVPDVVSNPLLVFFFFTTILSFVFVPGSHFFGRGLRISYWYLSFTLINVLCMLAEWFQFLKAIS